MRPADIFFGFLLMASVMEGVVVTSPQAAQYVPGVLLFLLPAINAGIAVWLKQMVPFLSPAEQSVARTETLNPAPTPPAPPRPEPTPAMPQ